MFAKETLELGRLQGPFGLIILSVDEENKVPRGTLAQGSHTLVRLLPE